MAIAIDGSSSPQPIQQAAQPQTLVAPADSGSSAATQAPDPSAQESGASAAAVGGRGLKINVEA